VHSQDGLEPAPTKPFLKFRGGFREIIGAFSKLSRTLEKWGGFREMVGAFSKLSRTLEKWGGFREIIGAFSRWSRTRPYETLPKIQGRV